MRREPVAALPHGERVYAIGDIHGRLDLLEPLMERIAQDSAARGGAHPTLIFLGDLIDRGPQSAQVIDFLLRLKQERPSTRFLLGNHEEVFLTAMRGDRKALAFFTRIGGVETILSYGITEQAYREADYDELGEMLARAVPAEHLAFLDTFEDMIVLGDYVFVHAGVRPSEPLDAQKGSDLRWIREEFLGHARPLEKVVVHGHTISEQVELLPHRIGVDTGAYRTGVLSAMGFEEGERWVVQAADAQEAFAVAAK